MSGTPALGTSWAYSRNPRDVTVQIRVDAGMTEGPGEERLGARTMGEDLAGRIPDGEAAQVPPL